MKNTLLRLVPIIAFTLVSLHAAEDPRLAQLRAADDERVAAVSMTACHGTHKFCRPAAKHPGSAMAGFDSHPGSEPVSGMAGFAIASGSEPVSTLAGFAPANRKCRPTFSR